MLMKTRSGMRVEVISNSVQPLKILFSYTTTLVQHQMFFFFNRITFCFLVQLFELYELTLALVGMFCTFIHKYNCLSMVEHFNKL